MTDQTDPTPANDELTQSHTSSPRTPPPLAAQRLPDHMGARAARLEQPQFVQPVRQILLMLIVLVLVVVGAVLAYGRIWPIFAANMWLNGTILTVFVLGVLTCFWQVAQLVTSVSWIERFAARRKAALANGLAPRAENDTDTAPRLLAPLAALLGRRGPMSGVISTGSARSILESVETRVDEARDITRYMGNLLIFLGLFGTFYGLATTVPAVVETIRALAPQDSQTGLEVFDKLMTGLEAQLGGMGTAFSSSLLGLAGSLIVGLLELFVSHGQNRFYRELEEWMSDFTRISLSSPDGEGVDSAAIAGFLDQLGEQMQSLQLFYAERDSQREQLALESQGRITRVLDGVDRIARHMANGAEASIARADTLMHTLSRLADGQARLVELGARDPRPDARTMGQLEAIHDTLSQLVEITSKPDAEAPQSRMHLRSIDDQLSRLLEENATARADMMAQLRSDMAILQKDMRALGGDDYAD